MPPVFCPGSTLLDQREVVDEGGMASLEVEGHALWGTPTVRGGPMGYFI